MADQGPRRGLVLGGGGVAGIAWELGVLAALIEAGIDLEAADVVVGTSAGSVAGAALRQGAVPAAYALQFAPAEEEAPETSGFDVERFRAVVASAQEQPDEIAARSTLGRYALSVPQERMPAAARIAMIESQLPAKDWPERDLRVTAVDAETGEFVVQTRASGVPLAAAVMASCSVPGVWPTMPVGGRQLMDGGVRSGTNADVADDCDVVLIIACMLEPASSATGPTMREVAAEIDARGRALVAEADAASTRAFGLNPLLMSSRSGSARAGHEQGARIAAEVAAFWNPTSS
ncbi:MAG TPA: patatin-like phospholipase family protein [Amnibacterium sp.]|uniref:patatin-like phospholipase family protein n=1 Tax=Amnibacterium sp. TaxID=1872496 RepID=UPI002F920570